jgi:hypothetical protein
MHDLDAPDERHERGVNGIRAQQLKQSIHNLQLPSANKSNNSANAVPAHF